MDTPTPTDSAFPLWLSPGRREGTVLGMAFVLSMALLIPYALFGPVVIGPLFGLHVLFLSLPHHAATLMKSLPKGARTKALGVALTASLALAIPLSAVAASPEGSLLNRLGVTGISLLSVWHIYRQHLGLCRIYTRVQITRKEKREGGWSGGATRLAHDTRFLEPFLMTGSFAMVVMLFARPSLRWANGGNTWAEPIYPRLPALAPIVFYAVVIVLGAALLRDMILRAQRGEFVPWPQLLTAVLGVATNNVPFLFVPTDATLLVVTIASCFHIVQYVGFVWLFEQNRADALPELAQRFPQRAAAERKPWAYWGAALGYSLLVLATLPISTALFGGPRVGIFFVTLSNVLHYIFDGFVWRRGVDASLGATLRRIALGEAMERST